MLAFCARNGDVHRGGALHDWVHERHEAIVRRREIPPASRRGPADLGRAATRRMTRRQQPSG